MNSIKLIIVFLIVYIILVGMAFADPCANQDPALKLIELSNAMKKEAARSYLRLDWNGTSVTPEEYDRLMETNKKHYDEDPNLRKP